MVKTTNEWIRLLDTAEGKGKSEGTDDGVPRLSRETEVGKRETEKKV